MAKATPATAPAEAPAEAPKADEQAPVEQKLEAVADPSPGELLQMQMADQLRAMQERIAELEAKLAVEAQPGQRKTNPVKPYEDPPGVMIESHAAWRFDR